MYSLTNRMPRIAPPPSNFLRPQIGLHLPGESAALKSHHASGGRHDAVEAEERGQATGHVGDIIRCRVGLRRHGRIGGF